MSSAARAERRRQARAAAKLGQADGRVLQRGDEDCARAVIATTLGVPYEQTPDIRPSVAGSEFWPQWTAWLAERGLEPVMLQWVPGWLDRWIASVGRDGTNNHFVVMSGVEVWHDPLPPHRRVRVRRADIQAAMVLGPLGDEAWRKAIEDEGTRRHAAGDACVWPIDRLLDSDVAVETYRQRGWHEQADAMLRRLDQHDNKE